MGDRLVVGLSTDEFNVKKGKSAIFGYEVRREILLALNFVDKVIPEKTWKQKRQDISRHDVKVLVMGDDWAGKFDHLNDVAEVVYLRRTENVSTTEIRNLIGKIEEEKLKALGREMDEETKLSRVFRY